MRISLEKLTMEAEATSFRPDYLEKVARLLGLLNDIKDHPFLKERLVLKSGTALNLGKRCGFRLQGFDKTGNTYPTCEFL
jgi:predicted nucleotidyltransferase component of viral defense system